MTTLRVKQAALVLVGLLAVPATVALLGDSGEAPYDPLPFDPLNADEQQRAIDIALLDPVVGLLLSDDYETIGAALRTEKVYPISDMARLADVWFYDYATNVVVWPVVDLDLGAVRNLETPPVGYQPPLTGDEMVRAGQMALAYPGVTDRLGAGEILPMARLFTGAGTPCPTHRCVTVGWELDGVLDFSFFVLVDLSTDEVQGIIDNDWFVPFEEGHQ